MPEETKSLFPNQPITEVRSLTRGEYKRLKKQVFIGVQLQGEIVSNPEVFLGNLEDVKNELLKMYYPQVSDPDTLSNDDFDRLYAPIETADPLGLAVKVISNTSQPMNI